MTEKRIKTPHDELTYKIIGCAMALHRNRGPGHRENTYQRDLGVYFEEESLHTKHSDFMKFMTALKRKDLSATTSPISSLKKMLWLKSKP